MQNGLIQQNFSYQEVQTDLNQERHSISEQFNLIKQVIVFHLNTYILYSFALNAEEQQYSGSCNFSLFDNSTLVFNDISGSTDTSNNIHIFALHYNVLRIEGGTAGLAFSS